MSWRTSIDRTPGGIIAVILCALTALFFAVLIVLLVVEGSTSCPPLTTPTSSIR